jgi:chromosome partitioning protein
VSVSAPKWPASVTRLDSATRPDGGMPDVAAQDSVTSEPARVPATAYLHVSRETVSPEPDGALVRPGPRHALAHPSHSTRQSQSLRPDQSMRPSDSMRQSGAHHVPCPPSAPPGAAGGVSTHALPPGVGWTPIAEEAERATRVKHPTDQLPRPARRRVLAVANQKGGVGKTTSTVNIAAGLAMQGLRTLVVDLDPQGNASTALGIEHRAGTPSVYEVLLGEIGIIDAVAVSPQSSNLLCIPATIDLAGAEIELVSMVARESRLCRALSGVALDELCVDYVFIDCPPSLGLLMVNSLAAAPEVLIPIQCEYYALEGLGQLLRNIELVQAHLNPALMVSTILLTMYDGRTRLADQVTTEVREHFGDQVLRTVIPRSVKVSEAPGFGQTVLVYDPGSRGALSYLDAAREIAQDQRFLDRDNLNHTGTDSQPGGREVSR